MFITAKDKTEYLYDYDLDPDWDETESLIVVLLDAETGAVVDALGGVEVPFQVSDHGNINVDPKTERYLRGIARQMADAMTYTERNSR